MSHVVEINSAEDLEGLRLLWRQLLGDTREASFFQSLDWLQVYWKHFGSDQQLRVLVVHAADKPVGILPLVVRPEATRLGTLNVLSYPLADWGSFYGPIGPNPTATLLTGLRHISQTARDWDVVDLRWVNQQRCDFRRTEQALRFTGLEAPKQLWRTAALVDFEGTWSEYTAAKSAKWRKNLKDKERKLARLGNVQHERYRPAGTACGDGDPRWDLYEACERIAASSWQGSSTTGTTLTHDTIRPFLREMHSRAAAAGAIDVNLLKIDGEPVAYSYHYHQAGYVSGLRMGYEPGVGREGAGSVLMARMLRDSFERGDRTFDLGTDYVECKRPWYTSLAGSYRYCHYAATGRAQALRLKRYLTGLWRRAA